MRTPSAAPRSRSSANAPTPSSKAPPFLPQDVFRLVVRLEAHKVLGDVDVSALERKFRVPLGYSEEDSQRKREKLELDNLPGPGAYDVEDPWRLDDLAAHESAAFASRIERDPYHLLPSPVRGAAAGAASALPRALSPAASPARRTAFDTSPPLGSFSRCPRGLESESAPPRHSHRARGEEGSTSRPTESPSPVPSLLSHQSAVFPRVSKDRESFLPASDPDIGPGMHDVRRLWDAPPGTAAARQRHRVHSDTTASTVFGASREKREVMWSPARTVPSCAMPEAWNASPHYAKQKSRVLRAVEREKRRKSSEEKRSAEQLAHSRSSPGLASVHARSKLLTTISSSSGDATDPFEWLRRQPQSEHRMHVLAAKYGLLEHAKVHHAFPRSPHAGAAPPSPSPAPESTSTTEHTRDALAHQVFVRQRSLSELLPSPQPTDASALDRPHPHYHHHHSGDSSRSQDGGNPDRDAPQSVKDTRIVVSCRLPGGMVLSATLFSRKRVRHLKACIIQSQTRFTHDEQFDLYLPSGQKLAHLDATLQSCGLVTRSLVQIVPSVALASVAPAPAPLRTLSPPSAAARPDEVIASSKQASIAREP